MRKFEKILKYILPYWDKAALNILFTILSVVFSLFSFTMVIPFLSILFRTQEPVRNFQAFDWSTDSVKHTFNYYLTQVMDYYGESTSLLMVSILVVIAVLLKTGFWYLANFFMAPLRNYVIRDIRNNIFQKVLQLHIGFFSDERKGDIISRMTGDVQEIETSIVRSLNVIFKEPVTIIVYLISLIIMSSKLTVVVLLLLPFTGLIIGRVGKNLRKKSFDAQVKTGEMLTVIEETISGQRIIKAFNSENKMWMRFSNINESFTLMMTKLWRRQYLATPLSEFLGTMVVVAIILYGGSLVLSKSTDMSSETFITYLIIFSQIINPSKAFSEAYYNILKGLASIDRVELILKAQNPITEIPDAKSIHEFNHSIEYRDVTFRYVETDVLKNINLYIKKGATIALVGQSGSGKSTFVDLLPRFYDVSAGDILIDNASIRDYKIADLRSLMGNVNQEPILFNDTIFNNIAFGTESCTYDEVVAAAKVANAHDFILETPDGYQTNIGDRGSKLSGGQRQRISIARAILKNPPILILDEATSSLDSESERLVQDALINLMKNRTSIIIAHRLSTVQHADEICVLHEGVIVERGKHDYLLKTNGYYKKLHDLQMFA